MPRDSRPAREDGSARHVGRPRRAATDAAIIRAAVELMTEGGVQATTLTAVARRAGVARATVYLRWPTRSALIGAAARAAVGGQVLPLTGDVAQDIRVGAAFVQRVFELPASQAILPEIVRGVLANPPELRFEAVAPRRREFARLYRAGAEAAGFDPAIDPHLPFDVLLGTAIAALLANGRPMSSAEADQLADVLIAGLRVQGPPTTDD
jgi:AcrR family transcriptional regulator